MKFSTLLISFVCSLGYASQKESIDCQIMKTKKIQMEVIASNIENVNTTKTPEGGPYRRKEIVCKTQMCAEISFADTVVKHLPGHPDADAEGNVKFPDIDLQKEMQSMIDARSSYEHALRNCKS